MPHGCHSQMSKSRNKLSAEPSIAPAPQRVAIPHRKNNMEDESKKYKKKKQKARNTEV